MSVYFQFIKRKSKKKQIKLEPAKASSHGREIFLEGGNSSAVLLLHGLTGTPREMSLAAKLLNKRGYTVLCPLLANHDKPLDILKKTKWQECYKSARDGFLRLEEAGKYKNIYVSGISVGALLVLVLADEFKERISAASCLSPTLFYDGWNIPWSKHLLPIVGYHTFLKHIAYFKEEPPYGIKSPILRKRIEEYYKTAKLEDIEDAADYGYPYMPVSLFYQNHLLAKYLTKRLGGIKVPVQLIQAKEDDLTSTKNSKTIYDKIGSEIKEMIFLEDSYHMITVDQERGKVVEYMDIFFKKIGK